MLVPKLMAVGAYVVFMALNIVGVKTAATFELFVTVPAIIELLVFMGVVAPGFSFANFAAKGRPRHLLDRVDLGHVCGESFPD